MAKKKGVRKVKPKKVAKKTKKKAVKKKSGYSVKY